MKSSTFIHAGLAGGIIFSILLERWTLPGFMTGAAISVFMVIVIRKNTQIGITALRGRKALAYFVRLIADMAISTLSMLHNVLSMSETEVSVTLVTTKAPDQTRVIVANSITLTPGTITLEETQEGYLVLDMHRKDKSSDGEALTAEEQSIRQIRMFEQRLGQNTSREGTEHNA